MRKKILIVEDNRELLDLLRSYLKASGFAVATAMNGIEALKKARSVSPDLVLLDLVLPELDGLAVYETLRKAPATASVPIIIVTGLPSSLARCAGLAKEPGDVMSKPVNPKHLVGRIKDLLHQTRGPANAPKLEKSKPLLPVGRMSARPAQRGSGLRVESRFHSGQPGAARRH